MSAELGSVEWLHSIKMQVEEEFSKHENKNKQAKQTYLQPPSPLPTKTQGNQQNLNLVNDKSDTLNSSVNNNNVSLSNNNSLNNNNSGNFAGIDLSQPLEKVLQEFESKKNEMSEKEEQTIILAIQYKMRNEAYKLPHFCKWVAMFLVILGIMFCSAVVIMFRLFFFCLFFAFSIVILGLICGFFLGRLCVETAAVIQSFVCMGCQKKTQNTNHKLQTTNHKK